MFGRVLVIGGSRDMLGAPVLAGKAALRMGSGLVRVALPRPMLSAALSICPELTGLGLTKGSREILQTAVEVSDCIVVGPGMGVSREAHERLRTLINQTRPLVIDADGLNLLASSKRWPGHFDAPAVLTPHPGEMKRLGSLIDLNDVPDDASGRIEVALEAARQFEQIVVLKGHRSVVAEPPTGASPEGTQRVYVNDTGDSSLSKAGTGDVLAGMIGSLIGQKMNLFDAACAAVHLHGLAGEIAGRKLGRRSVLASDVIDTLADAIQEFEDETRSE